MTWSMKIILPLGLVLLLTAILTHCSPSNPKYTDDIETIIDQRKPRYVRAAEPGVQYFNCRLNYFYDEEKGRCLSVPGGGRILHVENGRSCGVNILKSHCTSPGYYHICTRGRSILAQCESGRIFDSRYQRCITSRQQTESDDHERYNIPDCMTAGRFSVPGHCSIFYTCNRSGRRLYRSVYKCPRDTGYYEGKGICAAMANCANDDAVDSAVCVPDSPDEKLQPQTLDAEADAGKELEGTPETSEVEEGAQIVEEPKLEEKRDTEIEDRASSIMDNSQSGDNERNDDNGRMSVDERSTQPTENASPDNVESSYKSYIASDKPDESPIPPESTVSSSESDKADPVVGEGSPAIVNDEQQEESTTSHEVIGSASIDSSQSYTAEPSLASRTDDATQFDTTTETIALLDSASRAEEESQADGAAPCPEIAGITQSPIETIPKDAEKMLTVETPDPAEITEEPLEKDQPIASPSTTGLENDASAHSIVSAVSTREHSADADDVADSDVDTAPIRDTALSSSIYTSTESNGETGAATTAQYENDDTSSIVPALSPSAETVDQDPTSSKDTSASMSSGLNSDVDTSPSAPATDAAFPPESIVGAEQAYTTEKVFGSGMSAAPESELATPDPEEEDASGRSLLEHSVDSYLAPTTSATLIPEYVTASRDTATAAAMQDLPAISDRDSITPNDEDTAETATEVASLAPSAD